jgi:hypothetical protein
MANRVVAESIADCILRHGGDPDGGTCGDVFGVTGEGRRFSVVHGTLKRPLNRFSRVAVVDAVKDGMAVTRLKTLGQVRDFMACGWQVIVLDHGNVDAITNDGGVQFEGDWHPWDAVLRGRLVYAVNRFDLQETR